MGNVTNVPVPEISKYHFLLFIIKGVDVTVQPLIYNPIEKNYTFGWYIPG
jgi:hypothetical protein